MKITQILAREVQISDIIYMRSLYTPTFCWARVTNIVEKAGQYMIHTDAGFGTYHSSEIIPVRREVLSAA